jgi:hypothetical protein
MDAVVTITKRDLEEALEKWDRKAKAEGWQDRDDAEKYKDNAEYLFGLLTGNPA